MLEELDWLVVGMVEMVVVIERIEMMVENCILIDLVGLKELKKRV